MNLLDRYYARQLAMAVVKIITALSLLVIVIDLLVARGDNISKYQIPWGSVAAYYLSFLPFILFEYHAAAIAVLIAGLMVMGKSAQDNEVTAVLAGGVGLRRLARGPVLVALGCVVAAFVFQETAGVAAAKKFRELDEKYFSKAGGHLIRGVSWTQLGDGWTCHVLRYNLRANTGRDVFLHRIRPDQVDEIRAKRIFWDDEPGKWMLEDGRWAVFDPKKDWEVQSVRITQTQAPFTESPEKLFTLDAPPGTKNTIELAADIRRADAMNLDLPAQKVAYHLKFAQPMLCLVMIFLAIPFALRVRRGGVALGCVVAAFVFQETAGVAAAKKFRELDEKYFSKAGGHLIRGVSWTQLGDGWTCHVLRYNLRANTGRDVFLHRIRPDQVDEIRAKRIFWDDEPGKWMLEDGRWAVFDPKKDWEVQSVRITQTQAPFTESPEKLFTLDAPPGTKNTIELAADIRRADAMNLDLPAQKVAYHLKFAQPMLCLVMIFLAIPFALRVRRGGVALGFGVSVIIGLAYISLFYICVGLGYISKLPPPAAAWIPTIVFGLLGLELFRRLPT